MLHVTDQIAVLIQLLLLLLRKSCVRDLTTLSCPAPPALPCLSSSPATLLSPSMHYTPNLHAAPCNTPPLPLPLPLPLPPPPPPPLKGSHSAVTYLIRTSRPTC